MRNNFLEYVLRIARAHGTNINEQDWILVNASGKFVYTVNEDNIMLLKNVFG